MTANTAKERDPHQPGRGNHRWWNHFRLDIPDVIDELAQGRGFGRWLIVVGLLVALAGFGGWTYLIFHSAELIELGSSPFDERLLGLPAPIVALGALFAGGVIAAIGLGMCRAARARRR